MKILNALLDPGISPKLEPTPPLPEPLPNPINLNWGMAKANLDDSGLVTKDVRAVFTKGGAEYLQELKAMNGFSHDDAKPELLKIIRAALDGKHDAAKIPTREQLIKKNSDVRMVAKGNALKVSNKYCAIAADILEKSLDNLPKFTGKLLQQEAILYLGNPPQNSPLKRTCEELPKLIKVHIAKLRNPGRMTNPAELLK